MSKFAATISTGERFLARTESRITEGATTIVSWWLAILVLEALLKLRTVALKPAVMESIEELNSAMMAIQLEETAAQPTARKKQGFPAQVDLRPKKTHA